MSDTPRTDAFLPGGRIFDTDVPALVRLARTLERELEGALAEVHRLKEAVSECLPSGMSEAVFEEAYKEPK